MKKIFFILRTGIIMLWVFVVPATAIDRTEESLISNVDHVVQGSPSDRWILTLDGTQYDDLTSIAETTDGGFVVAGITYSFGSGGADIWVIKFNPEGSIAWQKTFGGSGDDRPIYIGQTNDGSFFVVGETSSFSLSENTWILRLTPSGDIVWQKTCCPTYYKPTAAHIASNGDLTLSGYSTLGSNDYPIIRLRADGSIVWQKTSSDTSIWALQKTSDGGFVAVTGGLMRLDTNGDLMWHKGIIDKALRTAQKISDGGFIVNDFSLWIARLTPNGSSITWQKALKDTSEGFDKVLKILQSNDGGFIALLRQSYVYQDGDKLLKLDTNGNLLWQKTYQGFSMNDITKTTNGGMVAIGRYPHEDGIWNTAAAVLKLDEEGNISPCGLISESTATITDTQGVLVSYPVTITTTDLQLVDTSSAPVDTGVIPRYLCQEGRQMPKLIDKIFTTTERPNVILVSLHDPFSNLPILPQLTLNGGNTWHDIADHPYSAYITGMTPRDDPWRPVRLFAVYRDSVSSGSLYRSGDGGWTWSGEFIDSNWYSFAISPKNSERVFGSYVWSEPCSMCDPPLHTELYQSIDGGVNWNMLYSSVGYEIIKHIAPSPANETDGFFKINWYFGGVWWLRFGNTDILTFPVDLIALDALDANLIYGVTSNFSSGQTSSDGGQTWIPWASVPPPACVQLMAHPTKTNILYLRCATGLFRSTNSGDSWQQITTVQGDALAPHLGNPGQILWSHDGCLFDSDDDGDSWETLHCFISLSHRVFLPILHR